MRKTILIILLLVLYPQLLWAVCGGSYTGSSPGTITAYDASQECVAAAVAAADDGDTVIIPAGAVIWTENVDITKQIRIEGAGVGSTVITANWGPIAAKDKPDDASYVFNFVLGAPSGDHNFGISNLSVDMDDKVLGFKVSQTSTTPLTKFRVHHTSFNNTINVSGQRLFFVVGNVYGVIDSNTFDAGGAIYGLNSNWSNLSFSYGSANQLYIEDNVISTTEDGNTGGGAGGRYCARYNTITRDSNAAMFQVFEYHGNQPGANNAGMGMELYGNKITNTSGATLSVELFQQRGGMAAVYYNYIDRGAGATTWAKVREEYVDDVNVGEPAYGPTGQPQHVSDSYYFVNTENGSSLDIPPYVPEGNSITYPESDADLLAVDLGRTIPEENFDYFNYTASFNGTAGVGCGTLASRPASCTTGVGYWATTQSCSDLTGMVGANPTTPISGTLYKCTSTNTWTAYYTPYTYPHPLRSGCRKMQNVNAIGVRFN